jgi:hypothetical protein
VVGAAALLAVAVSGCGAASKVAADTPGTSAPAQTVATTTPPAVTASTAAAPAVTAPVTAPVVPTGSSGATTTSAPPVTVSGAAKCTVADLAVTLGEAEAAAGHDGLPILFRNTGPVTCILGGYPGVALLDSSGAQAAQATRTPSGYLGGVAAGSTPPVVTLAPGVTASALLEGSDVPTGTATSCPGYQRLLVTPPGSTASVAVADAAGAPSGFPGCANPQIHPVVAGTTGRELPG